MISDARRSNGVLSNYHTRLTARLYSLRNHSNTHSTSMMLIDKLSALLWIVSFYCVSSQNLINSNDTTTTSVQRNGYCGNDSNYCPTWFICKPDKHCQCGDSHNHVLQCNAEELTSAVLDCNCVTYDGYTKLTYVGACFYNCENNKNDRVYKILPKSPETLTNKSVCTEFHRKGLLCGDCEEGHSPFVLSYNLSCVKCPDGHKNWWKFFLVAFVPLTFFYFFVVLFNINITSSRLHGVVWFGQALSTPALARVMMNSAIHKNQQLVIVTRVVLAFYSFWNLDILRSVIPEICLNVTNLQAFALDYLLALYPFALISFSYFLIQLHDRKCACIVVVWKPFNKVLTVFRKSWDIRTSVIDSFSTFFLLSCTKILSVTIDLLVPTQIFELNSNRSMFGLYYLPAVTYFSAAHLPYAITALVLLTLFVIIPSITLILYPFSFFQKLLFVFPINWHFLHAFIDSFQGCFKDGTEPGTLDCRCFSVVMLLVRLLFFLIFGLTLSTMFFCYAGIFLVIITIAVINIDSNYIHNFTHNFLVCIKDKVDKTTTLLILALLAHVLCYCKDCLSLPNGVVIIVVLLNSCFFIAVLSFTIFVRFLRL